MTGGVVAQMTFSKIGAASPQQNPNRSTHRASASLTRTAEQATTKVIGDEVRSRLGYEISPAEVAGLIAGALDRVPSTARQALSTLGQAVREARLPPDAGYLKLLADTREGVVEDGMAFLQRMFRPGDLIELRAIDPQGRRGETRTDFGRLGVADDRARLEGFIGEQHGRRNIYLGINPRLHRGGKAQDVAARRNVVLDLDFGSDDAPSTDMDRSATLSALRALNPSAVVESGGGYHVWFPVEELAGTGALFASAQALAPAMRAVHSDVMSSAPQPIRLPGTINIPNTGKRAKGRTLAWSRLVEWHEAAPARNVDALAGALFDLSKRVGLPNASGGPSGGQSINAADDAAKKPPGPALQAPDRSAVLRAMSRLPNDPSDDSHFPTRDGEVAVAHAVRGSIIGTDFADDPEIRQAFIEWAGLFGDDPAHAGDLYDGIRSPRTGWPHLRVMVHGRVAAAAFEDNPLDSEQKAFVDAVPSSPYPGVEPWVADINQRYAYVESVDRIADINPGTGQVDKWLPAEQFRVRLDNQKVGNMGAGRAWLTNPRRRQHTSFGWWPVGNEPKGALNLWRGFPNATGLARDPDWRPLSAPLADALKATLDFINDVIASGRPDVNEHVLSYLAWKVQHPTQRPGTALALVGASGTGKSTLGDMLGDLFGAAHSRSISKPNQAIGQFNALLEGAMVVRLEEAFFGRDRSVRGAYKDMVTSAVTNIERKGVDPIPTLNMAAIIVTSNEMSAIPHEAGERRTTFIKVSDAHRRDAAYFGTLHGNWTAGGREAFLDFLLHLDVSGFNPRQALDTPEKAAASAENGDMPVQFWNGVLESGALPLMINSDGTEPDWCTGSVTVPRHTLHGAYVKFVQDRHGRAPHLEGAGELARRLLDLCPGAKEAQVRPGPNQPGVRSVIFPPLDGCRAAFTKALGGGG